MSKTYSPPTPVQEFAMLAVELKIRYHDGSEKKVEIPLVVDGELLFEHWQSRSDLIGYDSYKIIDVPETTLRVGIKGRLESHEGKPFYTITDNGKFE